MRLVEARLVRRELAPDRLPGWSPLEDDVPVGKVYVLDLDRQALGVFLEPASGTVVEARCIWAVLPAEGYMPAICFGLAGGAPKPAI